MRNRLVRPTLAFVALLALPMLWFACTAPMAGNAPAVSTASKSQLDAGFHATVKPFVQTYCVSCHGGKKPEAELDLSTFTTLASVAKDPVRWDQVLERVKAGEMPPDDADKLPTANERKPFVAWLETMH
ncbi:MAG: c-type cytochrome domain-containing protein, partial [Opitutaceae bacterium]